ncbi:hypothetical protein AB0G32_28075, partial [Streptomyces sp. NPDC023723]|uniref:hypothetical protein n=1 Tax=Streptomyces sp. NPDC023723 TaxID=3154323 RepID=UPI0033F19867
MPLFDVQPIRELGQLWIDTGERLFEYLATMHGSVLAMNGAWTGRAGAAALQSWTGGPGNVWNAVWQAAYVMRSIGETILQYAEQLQNLIDEIARQHFMEGLSALFGMLTGFVAFGVAGLIGRLLSVVARLVQTMTTVIARLVSAAGSLGRAGAFVGEAALNAATALGEDVFSQWAASKAAGAPFKVDWQSEGLNMGLGVWMGAGMSGPDHFPGAASKVAGLGAKIPLPELPTNRNVPVPRAGTVTAPTTLDGLPGMPNGGAFGEYGARIGTSTSGSTAPGGARLQQLLQVGFVEGDGVRDPVAEAGHH